MVKDVFSLQIRFSLNFGDFPGGKYQIVICLSSPCDVISPDIEMLITQNSEC